MLYLDTSALAKLYLTEPESNAVEQLVDRASPLVFTSALSYSETLSALWRARRERRLSRSGHSAAANEFLEDWQTLQIVDTTKQLLSPARALIEKHHLRGADAVHLCSALWLGVPDFACFDSRLASAASVEGLSIVP